MSVRILLLSVLLSFVHSLLGQFASIDNNTGYWTDPSSWIGQITPGTTVSDTNIFCFGELISLNCLDFDKGTLYVKDTLVINGNLLLKNDARMEISAEGVLLVYGDYTSYNKVEVINDGILVVAGSYRMLGADTHGYFNNNSGNLFIFDPKPDLGTGINYTSIECTDTSDFPVNCKYGNEQDLSQLSIYSYFTSHVFYEKEISTEGNSCFQVNFVPDDSVVCRANEIIYKLSYTGISAMDTLIWDFGEGANSSVLVGIGPFTVEYETAGLKTVTLEILNDTILTFENLVEIKKCIELDFESDKNYVCSGDTVTFTNLSTGIHAEDYPIWDFGVGAEPITLVGDGPFMVVYNSAGNKDVMLEILNDTFNVKQNYIFVSNCYPLDYEVSSSTVCTGESVYYINTSFDAKDVDTLIWNFGEGAIPQNAYGAGPHEVFYEIPGTKDILISQLSGIVTDNAVKNVLEVQEGPITGEILAIEYNSDDGYYLDQACTNNSSMYTVEGDNNSSFIWTIPSQNYRQEDGNSLRVDWTDESGEFLIFVQEISEARCAGTVSDGVVLVEFCDTEEDIEKSTNYTFTPNNDGFNDSWIIENIEDYPLAKVYVFDRTGKLVFKSEGYYQNDWDGTYRGIQLKLDSYYYLIDLSAYNLKSVRGLVTLIH